MEEVVIIALASWLAGIASFIGGVVAMFIGTAETEGRQEIIHGTVAFGGGILVAAVAFALVPEGLSSLSPVVLGITFCAGGLTFCVLDIIISRSGGSKAQFMAMLLDFVPEAMALGALFGDSHRTGMLLALFIGAQNLPEGFNAYRESILAGAKGKVALVTLLAVSLLGPLSACCGYLFLRDQQTLTASIMSAASGGILYLVFQDIAPQAKMRCHWTPPLGAVLGFMVGMIGKQVLG
ncbi:ZIP family metal transporter [Desulforhopalus singaporensis]|uniref:Zinc transporter, ZIP family n=1 Tax=Desulforhopalus singaporensis TaxID=91360 RepID=A0A1H0RN92_9BACT|nr:divalent cation transporter [Desulforhopalus singaporensis]SDP30982.1 zinc transporter, ZIP family [Desulforhopalus singaporensis]